MAQNFPLSVKFGDDLGRLHEILFCKDQKVKNENLETTLFNDPTRDSIANNFVISFYC